ncbi:MAG: retropepsin-like aspartic protease [Bryobacteraceae bacterium]
MVTHGANSTRLTAKVDTGAEFCLFSRAHAETLGIVVESGLLCELRTVNGSFRAYGHDVRIRVLGIEFDLMAYFAADSSIHRSLLGRRGWLDRVRIGIIDHDQLLYLSHYDD